MGWFWMELFIVCLSVTLTDAECHCNTTSSCAVFPSTPCSQVGDPDKCQEGWFGPYCQKQNIALRRSSSQSSTLGDIQSRFGAALGIDGRATTIANIRPLTCAHTEQETNPTWTVNLNTSVPEKIQHIRLYIREILQERSNGMEILVGSQMCYNWSSTEHPPPIANVTCRQPLTGTNVTIRIPAYTFLTLCEVQIFVCSDGWFSEDCDKQCRCLHRTEVCDKITGHCSSGCSLGQKGADCQTACHNGSYGISCSSQCGNCLDDVSCDRFNGTCPDGCAAGWINDTMCQNPCQNGSHGINCSSHCGNCLNEDICDKETGSCPKGCAAGWINDNNKLCKQPCPDGSYGINCASKCGNCLDGVSCDKTNGACFGGCTAGWINNDTCLKACPNGYHGNNCAAQCGNCLDGAICDKTNGTCPGGCAAGWVNDEAMLCLQRCAVGEHGNNCTLDCRSEDVKARDRHCEDGCSWSIAVTSILGVLLICIVTGGTIYFRRLRKQLESLKTKMREEHYVKLDERTKTTATESTYEHIDNATPYYNTVSHVQDVTR